MNFIVENEEGLDKVVEAILKLTVDVKVVFLHGDLGAGKTTFVKHFVQTLGSLEDASSPTYSLVNEYETSQGTVYHIDLYRLNDTHEAIDMGIEEYLDSNTYCFVEWPQIIKHLVDNAIVISIETLANNSRKFEIELVKL